MTANALALPHLILPANAVAAQGCLAAGDCRGMPRRLIVMAKTWQSSADDCPSLHCNGQWTAFQEDGNQPGARDQWAVVSGGKGAGGVTKKGQERGSGSNAAYQSTSQERVLLCCSAQRPSAPAHPWCLIKTWWRVADCQETLLASLWLVFDNQRHRDGADSTIFVVKHKCVVNATSRPFFATKSARLCPPPPALVSAWEECLLVWYFQPEWQGGVWAKLFWFLVLLVLFLIVVSWRNNVHNRPFFWWPWPQPTPHKGPCSKPGGHMGFRRPLFGWRLSWWRDSVERQLDEACCDFSLFLHM